MKKTGLLVLLLAIGAFAQQNDQMAAATPANSAASADQPPVVETTANFPRVQVATPTYADLYCAGFINKQVLPNDKYIGGGLHTPNTTSTSREISSISAVKDIRMARSIRFCVSYTTSTASKPIPESMNW
jgi:hypothetical protein